MKHVWTFLVSRNTAIVLLIAVSLVLLIGAALPNPDLMLAADAEKLKAESPLLYWLGEHFNSMRVGKSPVFGLVGILLVISTTFCSIDRVVKRLRSGASGMEAFSGLPAGSISLSGGPEAPKRAAEILNKDGWRTVLSESAGRRVIVASKGHIGFWGSIFFHGVLVTLIGGLLFFYFTGFYATLVLTEGQQLPLLRENLASIERMPPLGISLPPLQLRFERFEETYFDDRTALDHTALLTIFDSRGGVSREEAVKVNRPFVIDGIEFILHRRGYSPKFTLYERSKPVFGSFVALNTDNEGIDSFDIPEQRITVTAQFFPDMVRSEDGRVSSKSDRPHNPYYGLTVVRDGRQMFRGLVGKGGSVSFGEYRLEFAELRYWITLNLVHERGIGFFFACSMIGLAGLLVRMADPDRQVAVVLAPEGKADIFCSGRHFDAMLREKALALAGAIETAIREDANNVSH